jgi:hypothetical protein
MYVIVLVNTQYDKQFSSKLTSILKGKMSLEKRIYNVSEITEICTC